MNLFGKRKKEREDKKIRDAVIERLSGKVIKYCSERAEDGSGDIIIGKDGSLTIRDQELIVLASADIVFRCDIYGILASELLSRDGVILEGYDKDAGKNRKIIAYYKYYR